jgi:hypothetical protein
MTIAGVSSAAERLLDLFSRDAAREVREVPAILLLLLPAILLLLLLLLAKASQSWCARAICLLQYYHRLKHLP